MPIYHASYSAMIRYVTKALDFMEMDVHSPLTLAMLVLWVNGPNFVISMHSGVPDVSANSAAEQVCYALPICLWLSLTMGHLCGQDAIQNSRRDPASLPALKLLSYSMEIWLYRSGPTFAKVMACCLTAPNHYLSQCWLIIKSIFRHLHESNFKRSGHGLNT